MKKIFITMATLASSLFINSSYASCTVNTQAIMTPMPLQATNITVGDEIPVGSRLLWQTYNLDFATGAASWYTVTCTDKKPVKANYTFSKTPMPLSPWSPNDYSAGKVYQTNVPGIGVLFHQGVVGAQAIPVSKLASNENNAPAGTGCESGTCLVIGNYKRWDVVLIKTGPVKPGTLLGSSLPCVQVNYTNDVNTPANMLSNTCITGAINIVSSTCKTPDVNVILGTHQVQDFKGKGSATEWVDTSINLTNCPTFHGYNSAGSWYVDGSGTNNAGSPTQNSLELEFSPVTTVLDSAQGIIGLSEESNSASGIGIQIASGTSASAVPFNLGQKKEYPQPIGSQSNVTIPLVSRYIQTEDKLKPGKANGMMKFIINYY
ncbi:hypothetical protein ED28_15900 [[Pantoea] beijingensis]|uniref:Fimbrial-type adhesion domain-containing protein n=1 Tax=[Pantoea] beijingensis TaxID=1324864 RepID=A0A443IA50_9GAMM|nr:MULTISPECIES: fimbrial protein [Erwiniaceae]RWR00933.1 hypothetical protein ED28_15900 [[Pantoea] beijingensis]